MSNHMPIPAIHMDENIVTEVTVYTINVVPGIEDQHNSSELCCNECCPFCTFLVFQSVSMAPYGDKEKVVNLDSAIQLIYIKSIIPPPKA